MRVVHVTASDSVTLDAQRGSITDDGPNNSGGINATNVTLTASAGIGAPGLDDLDMNAGTLTATANNGSIYVFEANNITLANVTAIGAGHDV
jgi:hypothetical protein